MSTHRRLRNQPRNITADTIVPGYSLTLYISSHQCNAKPIFFIGDMKARWTNLEVRKRRRRFSDFEKDLWRFPFCLRMYFPSDVI